MTKYAMFDLETLSLQPDAAVVSIGVAIFDDEQVLHVESWALGPEEIHGHIDPATVAWWMHEDRDGARQATFGGKSYCFNAGYALKTLLAEHNVAEVWANDPDYDLVVLKSWWNRYNSMTRYSQVPRLHLGDWPIKYWRHRSYRTIMGECAKLGHDTKELKGFYVAHDAGEDAAAQARAVIAARKLIASGVAP